MKKVVVFLADGMEECEGLASIDLLRRAGVEVFYFNDPSKYWTNLTFTRDIALITPKGAILNRFAMYFHQGETKLAQEFLHLREFR